MKKSLISILALVLSCLMLFAACGSGADKDEDKVDETTVSTGDTTAAPEVDDTTAAPEVDVPAAKTDAEKVADYVAAHGSEIIDAFESGFTSSGMTCNSTVEAVDTGIVLKVCINELVDLPEEQKTVMQNTFDQMGPTLDSNFGAIQQEIAELTYIKVDICEKDGDLVATFTIDGSSADAPVEDEPEVDTPVATDGVATYTMGSEEEGFMVVVSFISDANGNVAQVMFGMIGDETMLEEGEDMSVFNDYEDGFAQLKNNGCNITYDYVVEGTIHTLEATITVSSESDAIVVNEFFGVEYSGSVIKFADVDAAMVAEGFTEYTE